MEVVARHFLINEEDSFVQYSLQMSETKYNELINEEPGTMLVEPGKNKLLI